jgi:4-alpha-glucanotransferase
MDDRAALKAWAAEKGVATHYSDGLGRQIEVGPETLAAVCATLGAPLDGVVGAARAYRAYRNARRDRPAAAPVVLAWDGRLPPVPVGGHGRLEATLILEGGDEIELETLAGTVRPPPRVPFGIHTLAFRADGRDGRSTVIAAPTRSWRRDDDARRWGLAAHLAALRSRRSRALGDLADLARMCAWAGALGADTVTVLPLLPTFNQAPAEPSPYSPVSRLFWSELILDLGKDHRAVDEIEHLDVTAADREVRRALAGRAAQPLDGGGVDEELSRYAAFRGAQLRMGRNWRDWPEGARAGRLDDADVDPDERRFHETAQTLLRRQLSRLRSDLDRSGVRLGLDLAVGAHPDGYDAWSRQELFAPGMAVGAPPDPGFPSGQDWGFAPILPARSRAEGHRYLSACMAHQAAVAGVLRLDHVMAFSRLYWIPRGLDLDRGTYVSYPAEELFGLLTLHSHRYRCEIVGENLGTVPDEIREALPRHRIWGMYLSIFDATGDTPRPPRNDEVAFVGSHDTPTFVGWLEGRDIEERVRSGLLAEEEAAREHEVRREAVDRLATTVGGAPEDPSGLLDRVLNWLADSDSPLVLPWLEDLWLEPDQVNLPGTRSSERPNWQRPMALLLDDIVDDEDVRSRLSELDRRRRRPRDPTPLS